MERVKVWDPFVRLVHWGLAAVVIIAYATGEESRQVHEIAGLAAVLLVALRAAWGLIGPESARFASFVRGPGTTLSYIGGMATGSAPRHLGHSPAGGAMAMLLLALVVATGLTGVLMVNGVLPHETGEELHEILGTLILVAAGVHVAGVLFSSWQHRENLMRAMVTGWKREVDKPT